VGFSVEDLKDFHSRICNNVALLTRKTTAERQKKKQERTEIYYKNITYTRRGQASKNSRQQQ